MTFISMAILLFFVIDPIGNIPIFLSALRQVPREHRRRVVLRECAIAFGVLLAFMFIGRPFLRLLHLSEPALGIAGGIILFLIALKMIFPTPEGLFGAVADGEPLLFPLAVPTVAGPSALATVLLLVSAHPVARCIGALVAVMGVTTAILLGAERIAALAGRRVMTAVERLMGLILTAIAVEMLLQGIRAALRTL